MRRAARRRRRELAEVGERRFHERRQRIEGTERAAGGARPHGLPPSRRAEAADAELGVLGGQAVRRTGGQEHRREDRRPDRPTTRPPVRPSHGTPNGKRRTNVTCNAGRFAARDGWKRTSPKNWASACARSTSTVG